ncbi:SDR family NAD(P)-dependent oxidoreductase [Pseudaestuariivita sp.]|uniref:SDR family NAD(P)-dependent oxidoreductase n=1 Tax=Pseudaestuariivita sp. TaxID=2211669 RepID=UPI004058C174
MAKALVFGSSGGIGSALVAALEGRGHEVTGLSRSSDGVDVTDEASVSKAAKALKGPYEIILCATGALEIDGATPEKTIRSLDPKAMMDQFATNAIGPAMVLKHAGALLPRDKRSVMAVLSARVGSIGDNQIGGWYSYRVAKAAVNQVVHTAAIELRRTHKEAVCVALHPGTVATKFTEKYAGRHKTTPPDETAEMLLDVLDGLSADQSGGFFDYAGKEIPW